MSTRVLPVNVAATDVTRTVVVTAAYDGAGDVVPYTDSSIEVFVNNAGMYGITDVQYKVDAGDWHTVGRNQTATLDIDLATQTLRFRRLRNSNPAVGVTLLVFGTPTGDLLAGDDRAVVPGGPSNGTGPAGPPGVAGAKGDTGAQGPKGDTGDAGPAGTAGAAGAKGDTGLQGPKGDTGNAGSAGAKGDTGTAGTNGTQGATGAVGPGYAGTSSTSLVTGTGSKAFTTQAGLAYAVGTRMRATSVSTGEFMEGLIASYADTALTLTSDYSSGSGTRTDWVFTLANNPAIIVSPLAPVDDDGRPNGTLWVQIN